jgi:hypothetical protein
LARFINKAWDWLRSVAILGLGLARFLNKVRVWLRRVATWLRLARLMNRARVRLKRVSIPGLGLAKFMNRVWVMKGSKTYLRAGQVYEQGVGHEG